jgi:hypothetical protein
MSIREKIGPRAIHLATSDEWNRVSDAGAALDVAGRDRLETTRTHLHSTDGRLNEKKPVFLVHFHPAVKNLV